ncbi:MAG: hypothetical protein KF768_12535 [Phycisphaeraceae bacterium]|nr:hypothetical protein [Phycisphaeraceae bacterium]
MSQTPFKTNLKQILIGLAKPRLGEFDLINHSAFCYTHPPSVFALRWSPLGLQRVRILESASKPMPDMVL